MSIHDETWNKCLFCFNTIKDWHHYHGPDGCMTHKPETIKETIKKEEPWLKQTLKDAVEAKNNWPEWAKDKNNTYSRLSKPEYLCYLALAASSRAEDIHTRVGGVIVNKDWRVLTTAFNGWKPGMEIPPQFLLEENRTKKGEYIIHCEQNLFNFYHDVPYAIGLTISPCHKCSDTIIAHSIKEVYYIKEYERDAEKKFKQKFDFYGIKYFCMTSNNIKNILRFIKKDTEELLKLI